VLAAIGASSRQIAETVSRAEALIAEVRAATQRPIA
jgi:hypothetical protein